VLDWLDAHGVEDVSLAHLRGALERCS
jgi:hypothetical protein